LAKEEELLSADMAKVFRPIRRKHLAKRLRFFLEEGVRR
jgi:hypothetical protein